MRTYIYLNKVLIIVSLIFISLVIVFSSTGKYLVISNDKDQMLEAIPVHDGEEFVISFIHSSELEPWDNAFSVEKNYMMKLKEIRVPSTGPGVPSVLEEGWSISIEDGFFVYKVNNKEYEKIEFIVSSISPHHLYVGNKDINLVELAGDWGHIIVRIQKQFIPLMR